MKNVVNTSQQENTLRDSCGEFIFVHVEKLFPFLLWKLWLTFHNKKMTKDTDVKKSFLFLLWKLWLKLHNKKVPKETHVECDVWRLCGKHYTTRIPLMKFWCMACGGDAYPPVHIQVDIDYLLIFLSRIPLLNFWCRGDAYPLVHKWVQGSHSYVST